MLVFIVYNTLHYIMKKEKDIQIRVDNVLKEELKKLANEMGLSLSSFIRIQLIEIVKKNIEK